MCGGGEGDYEIQGVCVCGGGALGIQCAVCVCVCVRGGGNRAVWSKVLQVFGCPRWGCGPRGEGGGHCIAAGSSCHLAGFSFISEPPSCHFMHAANPLPALPGLQRTPLLLLLLQVSLNSMMEALEEAKRMGAEDSDLYAELKARVELSQVSGGAGGRGGCGRGGGGDSEAGMSQGR